MHAVRRRTGLPGDGAGGRAPLADRTKEGPIPLDESLEIAEQIANALEAAHEKGVVHRDLKPGNVKIKPDGVVKVLDFGLAKPGAAGRGRKFGHSHHGRNQGRHDSGDGRIHVAGASARQTGKRTANALCALKVSARPARGVVRAQESSAGRKGRSARSGLRTAAFSRSELETC
ncbi:MAG TPA: protein kinase [Bryobacteraceae bacterium]